MVLSIVFGMVLKVRKVFGDNYLPKKIIYLILIGIQVDTNKCIILIQLLHLIKIE